MSSAHLCNHKVHRAKHCQQHQEQQAIQDVQVRMSTRVLLKGAYECVSSRQVEEKC